MPVNNTFIWTLIGSGDWSNPSNWDDDIAPTTGAIVKLPSEASGYTVTFSPVLAIDTLSVAGAVLDIKPGASLTVDNSSVINGRLTIEQGGTFSVASGATLTFAGDIYGPHANNGVGQGVLGGGGTLLLAAGTTMVDGARLTVSKVEVTGASVTVNANFVYAGAYSQSSGALTLNGGLSLTQASHTGTTSLTGGAVNGSGQFALAGNIGVGAFTIGGAVQMYNAGGLTESGGSLTIGDSSASTASVTNASLWRIADDSGIVQGASAAYFYNYGAFNKIGGTGTSTVAVDFFDQGTVTVVSGTLAFAGPVSTFEGKVSGAGSVVLTGGATTIAAGSAFSISNLAVSGGAVTIGAGAVLSVPNLTISGGAVTIGAGAVLSAPNLTISGGAVTIDAGAVFSVSRWSISGAQTSVILNEALSYSGAFSETANATLTLNGGLLLNGVDSFSNATVNGSQQFQTWGATSVSGLTIGGAVSWDNATAVTQSSGNVMIASSAYTAINNSGVWNITDDSGIGLAQPSKSQIANGGRFQKTGGAQTSTIAASFYSLGTVGVASGTLSFAGPSNLFVGAIAGAGTVQFSGGTSTLSFGTTIATAGFSEINAGTKLNVDEFLAYTGAFTLGAQASLAIGGDDTLILGGAANVAGAVSGTGAFDIFGVSAVLGSTASIASSAAITVSNWSIDGPGTAVTFIGGRTYAGAFSLSDGATLTLTAGTALTGSATFNDATINGSHILYTEGKTSVVDGLTIGGTAGWANMNTATQSAGDVTVGDSSGAIAYIYNTASGVYDLADNSNIERSVSISTYFNNVGAFAKTGGNGTSTIATKFFDSGTVSVASGTLEFTGQANNFSGLISGAGAIEFGASTSIFYAGASVTTTGFSLVNKDTRVIFDENLSYAGAFTARALTLYSVAADDTLTLTGTSMLSGIVSGAGTLAIAGGSAVFDDVFATIANLTISGAATSVAVENSYAQAPYYPDDFVYSGAFSVSGGATLGVENQIFLGGSATFSDATVVGSPNDDVLLSGQTSVSGLTLSIGGLENDGTVTEGGAGLTLAGGFISNFATGVWDVGDSSGISVEPASTTIFFENSALLEKTKGASRSEIATYVVNDDVISATSGVLEFQGPLAGFGTVEVGNGATLQVDGYATGQTFVYEPSGGEFALNDLASGNQFLSLISGFGAGDSLNALGFGTGTTFQYANAGGTSGTLELTDGAKTANIEFVGSYTTASFNHVTTSAGTVFTFAS